MTLSSIVLTATGQTYTLDTIAGYEAYAELFYFKVGLQKSWKIPATFLGKEIILNLLQAGKKKTIHALIIAENQQNGRLLLSVAPALWLLRKTFANRCYQDAWVSTVIKHLLSKPYNIPYRLELKEKRQIKTILTQNNDSSFNFLTRVLAQENIHYYFDHTKNSEVVFTDTPPISKNTKEIAMAYPHNLTHSVLGERRLFTGTLDLAVGDCVLINKTFTPVCALNYAQIEHHPLKLQIETGPFRQKTHKCLPLGPVHGIISERATDNRGRYDVHFRHNKTLYVHATRPQVSIRGGVDFHHQKNSLILLDFEQNAAPLISSTFNTHSIESVHSAPTYYIKTPFGGNLTLNKTATLALTSKETPALQVQKKGVRIEAKHLVQIYETYAISGISACFRFSGTSLTLCTGVQAWLALFAQIDITLGPFFNIHPGVEYACIKKMLVKARSYSPSRVKRFLQTHKKTLLAVKQTSSTTRGQTVQRQHVQITQTQCSTLTTSVLTPPPVSAQEADKETQDRRARIAKRKEDDARKKEEKRKRSERINDLFKNHDQLDADLVSRAAEDIFTNGKQNKEQELPFLEQLATDQTTLDINTLALFATKYIDIIKTAHNNALSRFTQVHGKTGFDTHSEQAKKLIRTLEKSPDKIKKLEAYFVSLQKIIEAKNQISIAQEKKISVLSSHLA